MLVCNGNVHMDLGEKEELKGERMIEICLWS